VNRQSLYFTAPHTVELREEPLPAPAAGEVQVLALASLISTGTEMMIYKGDGPAELPADTTLSSLQGSLAFPLKYGYSMVGRVSALGPGVDPAWLDTQVFAFNPHESAFNARVQDLHRVPAGLSPELATLLPNTETAVSLIHDGEPRLGERVAVIGQGVVGLLTTALLAQHPLESLIAIEPLAARRKLATEIGAHHALAPDGDLQLARNADLVYELSGDPAALDLAIQLAGDHGRVVVGSWYGTRRAPVDLGAHFHRGRLRIISSQVTNIAPLLTGRWDKQRRFDLAWRLLANLAPAQLVSHRIPFARAAEAYAILANQPSQSVAVLLEYKPSAKR
jgi:2-desacetyl-2-hydroxyethyl bacteriochlorophyllide A dehydrogenase